MKNYYVYLVYDKYTNEFYIGSRGCICDVNKDKYLGSYYTWKPKKENLIKIILKSDFNSKEDCIEFEREMIILNISHSLNRNYSIPNINWNRDNKITAKDKHGKVITISVNDPLFGIEYFGVTKGSVFVIDKEGNRFSVDVNDVRYKNGELIALSNLYVKSGEEHHFYKKRWINNKLKQKMINIDENLPIGWFEGTLQRGNNEYNHKNTVWINQDNKNKRIKEDELELFLLNGWKKGRLKLNDYKFKKGNFHYKLFFNGKEYLLKSKYALYQFCKKNQLQFQVILDKENGEILESDLKRKTKQGLNTIKWKIETIKI